ncbi:hypothetical protein N510_001977 [Firmicutes bacterium ASF500]|nr:hypothetical protein N510_001977 [Firmicutes bacterium ASF500]
MAYQERQKRDGRPPGKQKWARAAGDHEVVSALGKQSTGQYLQDLDCESSQRIQFRPSEREDSRVSSVKPSCCAPRSELPRLAGQLQLTTGRADIGFDEKKKDMVFIFVRHENDAEGREVVENRARVQGIQGRERFRSNDGDFSTGAMELRCEAARTPRMVMNRFGRMSARNGGDTTMDRVLPFQNARRERNRARELSALEHSSVDGRTALHGAASAAAALAGKKEQKQREFRVKFAKAVAQAKEHTRTEDYQLYIKKKWEEMRRQAMEDGFFPELEESLQPEEEQQEQELRKERS